jgi:hypothetical protein
MQRTTSGAAGNGLYTTIKCMRGAAGIGLGTTTKHLRRTTSGAAGTNGLGATMKYLRCTTSAAATVDIFQGRAFALFSNANRTAKPNRAREIRRTEPELEFALLELKRTELRTNTPSTRAQRQGRLPFYSLFFFEKHTWSSSDVLLSPGVLLKFFQCRY